jgi:hypothetical protein
MIHLILAATALILSHVLPNHPISKVKREALEIVTVR